MLNFKKPRRFWSKVDVGEVDECWEWQASTSNGYGQFSINHKILKSHRVAWTYTFGKIPEGLYVCHKCDNKVCCNPYHLFLGTNQDNQVDAAKKGRLSFTKLTVEDVLDIREMYREGYEQQEIAVLYDVSNQAISLVLRGKTWSWL